MSSTVLFARISGPWQGDAQVLCNLTIDLAPPTMTFALWTLVIGVLLIVMVLSGTLLNRLPMSNAMLYLVAGFVLGPAGWEVVMLDPLTHAPVLERVAEVAVLISLFSVGLKLGLPLSNRMEITLPIQHHQSCTAANLGPPIPHQTCRTAFPPLRQTGVYGKRNAATIRGIGRFLC